MTRAAAAWAERHYPGLAEDLRSTLAIHIDNRVDVPLILRLVLTSIRQHVDIAKPVDDVDCD